MARKEFTYKGKTMRELIDLNLKDFVALLPARQRRSFDRGFTNEEKHLLEELKKRDNIKTHCREMIIFPFMVGKNILVYNGKTFNKILITEEMLGHVLGEFSLTKSKVAHSSPGVGATKSSAASSVK
jgi:small subunit ribosomal protein S19